MTKQTVAGEHTACKESSFLMKGRFDLKKIVTLTDHPEKHDMLITCLRRLFPECEIQVKPKEMEFLKMSRQPQGLATENAGEENRKTIEKNRLLMGVSDDKSKIKTEN